MKTYSTHYGHEKSLGHLRLLDSERVAIAGQLARGVDFQHILDNIRDTLGGRFQRIHLLTRKDITNIEKGYGLKVAQRHINDATSVDMWVEEIKLIQSYFTNNKVSHSLTSATIYAMKTSYLRFRHHYRQI